MYSHGILCCLEGSCKLWTRGAAAPGEAELKHPGLLGHSTKYLMVGRELLCSIWGSLGYNPPSQGTLRSWRTSSGPSVRPVLFLQSWLQLESLVLPEG